MDARAGTNFFKEYLLCLLGSKIVIYVTHQVEFLPVADFILVIKDVILLSEKEPMLSFASELLDHVGFQENEIVTKAFILLQKVILENIGWSLSLIVGDKDINTIVNIVTSCGRYNDIPLQSKHKLCAIGRILYVSAKASITCCNQVFESFFFRLMDTLGLSVRNSSGDCLPNFDYVFSERLNFGALYLCIEFLVA